MIQEIGIRTWHAGPLEVTLIPEMSPGQVASTSREVNHLTVMVTGDPTEGVLFSHPLSDPDLRSPNPFTADAAWRGLLRKLQDCACLLVGMQATAATVNQIAPQLTAILEGKGPAAGAEEHGAVERLLVVAATTARLQAVSQAAEVWRNAHLRDGQLIPAHAATPDRALAVWEEYRPNTVVIDVRDLDAAQAAALIRALLTTAGSVEVGEGVVVGGGVQMGDLRIGLLSASPAVVTALGYEGFPIAASAEANDRAAVQRVLDTLNQRPAAGLEASAPMARVDFARQHPEFLAQHGADGQAILDRATQVYVLPPQATVTLYRTAGLEQAVAALLADPASATLAAQTVVRDIPATAAGLEARSVMVMEDPILTPPGTTRPIVVVSDASPMPTLPDLWRVAMTGRLAGLEGPAAQAVVFTTAAGVEQVVLFV